MRYPPAMKKRSMIKGITHRRMHIRFRTRFWVFPRDESSEKTLDERRSRQSSIKLSPRCFYVVFSFSPR